MAQMYPTGSRKGLSDAAEPATPLAPLIPEAEEASGDWLSEALGIEATDEPADPPEAEPAPPLPPVADTTEAADDLPDWLAGIQPTGETPVPAATDEPTQAAEGDAPDWLAAARPAPSDDDVDVPDWLESAVGSVAKATDELTEEQTVASVPAAEVSEPAGVDADMPDWLAAMQPAASGAVDAEDQAPFDDDLFDWLEEEEEEGEAEEFTEDLADIEIADDDVPVAQPADLEAADLPAWLRTVAPTEEGGITLEVEHAAAAVSTGDIPEHMEMLRAAQIAGVLDPGLDTREEGAGPLKGVVGVMAARPIFTDVSAEAAMAAMPVEVDSAQISLLEGLLGKAPGEVEFKSVVRGLPGSVGRWFTYLLITAAIALPIVQGITPFATPSGAEVATADAVRSLTQLNETSSVLIAFEYDPAHTGELDAQAEALLAYLMERNVRIYAVSGQPTGPAIAQRVLEPVARSQRYVHGQDYTNLGYVPGKAAGINSLLMGSVEGAVSPFEFDYQGAETGLGNTTLNALNIDMIIVLTGRAETIRIWVEQAGSPGDIPMIAAVSAGSEPMVLPYYREGGQVKGVISGLKGATELALATQNLRLSNTLTSRWNAQVAGALAAGLVIVGGVAVQAVIQLTRNKSADG